MAKNNNTNNDIFNMNALELAKWLNKNYMEEIPTHLENAEDLKKAGVLLGKLTNIYSYIMSMLTYAQLEVKEKKKISAKKEEINECISRRDVLNNFSLIIKMQYTAISRMITVKKQVDDEFKML